jgi:hypothetical protein
MILFGCFGKSNNRESTSLFAMLDQIKHGVLSLLQNKSERIAIAELNYEAGTESFRRSNYTAWATNMQRLLLLFSQTIHGRAILIYL